MLSYHDNRNYFIFYMWEINWIVFPIGGMMCGIVSTILNKE